MSAKNVDETLNEMLGLLNNRMLAKLFRNYFDGTMSEAERNAFGMFYMAHLTEARRRKGSQANATADNERLLFNERYGIHEGLSASELDALYDAMTDSQAAESRGEVWHLIDALEADGDNYI